MKRIVGLTAAGLALSIAGFGEEIVVERGPHHDVIESVEAIETDGQVNYVTNRVISLGSGKNYFDPDQQAWLPSTGEFELLNNGAAYRKGPFKLLVHSNINDPNGALEFFPAPDTRLVLQTVGIAITSEVNGDSVWIGQIKNVDGILTAPNEITWPSCFEGIDASVRITLKPNGGGFENDVVLHERPDLNGLGLQGPLRIEAFHEMLSGPEPELRPGSIRRSAQKVDSDTQLAFAQSHGKMLIGAGTAFSIGRSQEPLKDGDKPVRVAKEYFVDPDTKMRFLIEAVPLDQAAGALSKLPASRHAFRLNGAEKMRLEARRAGDGKRRRPIALTERPDAQGRKVAAIERKPTPLKEGLLIDFTTLSGQTNNYVFAGNSTYLIPTNTTVTLTGTTVFEPSCVIKFGGYNPSGNTPILDIQGPVDCQTKPYAPMVLTSREDRANGETNTAERVSIISTLPYGAYHIYIDPANTSAIKLHDIRSVYASNAFGFFGSGAVEAWNIQVVNAFGSAFEGSGNTVVLRNVLVNQAGTVAKANGNSTTINGEHFTIHNVATNFQAASYTGCGFGLINSLLVGVTNSGSSGFNPTNCNTLSEAGIFQTVGAGAHYLADNSPYRNAGSTAISPLLATNVFQYSTTYPPTVLANAILANTVLAPRVERDLVAPDQGYHYPALDWVLGDTSLAASKTLTFTNGVAAAFYGTNALTLGSGAQIISEGRPGPLGLNRIVRYNTVQEQPTIWGTSSASSYHLFNTGSSVPLLSFRFTEVSQLANTVARTYLFEATSNMPDSVALRDCEFYSTSLYAGQTTSRMSPATIGITNNLFHRCAPTIYVASGYSGNLLVYNNLFRYGTFTFYQAGSGTWTANNNLFDHVSITVITAGPANSNNGYAGTSAMSGAVNTKTVTTTDYQSGPLGPWYYPTSGTGNLFSLVDNGTGTVASAGLYHYTDRTDQTKDSGTVDIGFHYLAMDSSALPVDSDRDGIPDYLEDRNGNGTADTGELNWTHALNDLGGLSVYNPFQP